ncbi:5'/3'-nucleotidase SurE [Agromyces sp. Marseille-Q5079]|uniref:5'/3'-nucleotidase SurE n=1 Tax=Agromyces sp. Marseille-Q5079 TaxID=3439059 RepID=UPI003D9CB3B2
MIPSLPRGTRIAATLLIAAAAAGATAAPASAAPATGAPVAAASAVASERSTSKAPATQPLRILLTNDDGWNAPGITAVYDALVAAGHDVTMFAPATNQSGVGARATFGGSLQVTQPEAGKYALAGSPADSVELGLATAFADGAPDLVISGTNVGQNIGAATVHSGTIGAAVTALNEGIPAIAVSTEVGATGGPFAETAAFVVRLVAQLDRLTGAGPILPNGIGLNVNYPIVDDGGTPGVALTSTGKGFLDVTGTGVLPQVGGTSSIAVGVNVDAVETVKNADTTALASDDIAITPITGSYDAVPNGGLLKQLVSALR